jgi:DNA-binding winged helix-turn-helix (wHTH) protein/predicted ATPase
MRFAFDDFEIDDELFELRRGGAPVALPPRAFDVLLYLLRHRDRVVSHTELIREIWQGVTVHPNVLAQALTVLRRAMDLDGENPRILQTVRSRGYRFIGEIRSPVPATASAASSSSAAPASVAPGSHRWPFVGRDACFKRLLEFLDDAARARPAIVLIAGSPGMGKTRLLGEFLELARTRGSRVARARCHADERLPDLWPWVQVLRGLAAEEGSAVRAEAAALLSDEQLALGEPDKSKDSDSEGRFRLFERVTRVLTGAGRSEPLVVLLDDMHAADVPSLLLLKFLARELGDSRLLVVCAYSDASLPHAAARAFGALSREHPSRRIALPALRPAEIARIAESALGSPPTDDLLTRLWAKTAGNPALLAQILHNLASSAALPMASSTTSALLADDEIREAIGVHLEGLSAPCIQLLRVASTLGNAFSIADLGRITGSDLARLVDPLDEAVRGRILRKVAGDAGSSYRFLHALVRDVLYRQLPAAERARLDSVVEDIMGTRAEWGSSVRLAGAGE